MKRLFIFLLLSITVISCNKKSPTPGTDKTLTKKSLPAFDDSIKNLLVKDLPVKTKNDTISFALGVAWANGLGKIGLNTISYSFYEGAHDYIVGNPSFTNAEEAGKRLDKEIGYLQRDSVYTLNSAMRIKDIKLSTKYDTLSYQLGYAWTRGAKTYGINTITPALLAGLTNGLQGDTMLFTYSKADRYLRSYVEDLKARQFSDIKEKNEQWLTENKTREDVITLPSGLQYKTIKNGKGKLPQADNVVVCHYTARLIDQTKVESTYDDGTPLKATPSGVIPALREALSKMRTGSVWELYVPYYLGYGSGGIKNKVPPFATLIYEVELLQVEDHLQ